MASKVCMLPEQHSCIDRACKTFMAIVSEPELEQAGQNEGHLG